MCNILHREIYRYVDYYSCSPTLVSLAGPSLLLCRVSVASLTLSLPSVWTHAPAP